MRLRLIAAAAAALATAVPAQAQAREYLIFEVVDDLVNRFCPLFIEGKFALTAPELAERGFGKVIPTGRRFPYVWMGDSMGQVTMSGIPREVCHVWANGPNVSNLLAQVRRNKKSTFDFELDEGYGTGDRQDNGISASELYRAKVNGRTMLMLVDRSQDVLSVAMGYEAE